MVGYSHIKLSAAHSLNLVCWNEILNSSFSLFLHTINTISLILVFADHVPRYLWGVDGLQIVRSAVTNLAGRWKDLGFSLGAHADDLDIILPCSPSDCLREVLFQWLRQSYNVCTTIISIPSNLAHFICYIKSTSFVSKGTRLVAKGQFWHQIYRKHRSGVYIWWYLLGRNDYTCGYLLHAWGRKSSSFPQYLLCTKNTYAQAQDAEERRQREAQSKRRYTLRCVLLTEEVWLV